MPFHQRHRFASVALVAASLLAASSCLHGQSAAAPASLSLDQAVDLALKRNKNLGLARLAVEENKRKKDVAFSHYLPQIKNESTLIHLTELAGVTIPAGAFGVPPATGPIPGRNITIDQGAVTTYTSGTGLAQPITQAFKIHAANNAATADVRASEIKVDDAENEIALAVRRVYYGILIAQQKLTAADAELDAAVLKNDESAKAVNEGRALEVTALEAQAALLNAKQEHLTEELELDDLYSTLDAVLDLPLDAHPRLEADASETPLTLPSRADAIRMARAQSPDVRTAQQSVEKARAGLAAAKDAYIPDVTGLARYSYQSGVPFLVHNFGTFGVSFTYDLFDGGKRESELKEARVVLAQAELNLSRVQDETDVKVRSAYDKVERLDHLNKVAEQVVQVRTEAARLSDRMFEQDASLASARSDAHAKSASAEASLLEARLGLTLARGELLRVLGQLTR